MEMKNGIRALSFLSFFNLFLLSRLCHAVNNVNLTQTQFIRDGETIQSLDGSFQLGFFSPGSSTKRYVGIWFAKITIQTVVWVANRETPLLDSSGVFKIGTDGNMVVLDGKKNILWSSNSSLATTTSVGVLLDSGNLVLCEKDVYWQSFDHPTDTFLPGMKFGMNLKTGENQLLTAWKNSDDPAPGEFSLGFDTSRIKQIMIWKSSSKYWRSGQWNGQSLTGVPEMSSFHLYGFDIIKDEDSGRLYCTYTNVNKSVISSFLLDSYGKLDRSYWNEMTLGWDVVWSQPNGECQLYDRCGPNGVCNYRSNPICSCLPGFSPFESGNWSAGCVRNNQLECKESELDSKDGFLKLGNMKLPDNSKVVTTIETIKDCEKSCKQSCPCIAYTYENGLGCLIWDREMKDIQTFSNGGQDLYLRLHKSDLKGMKKRKFVWLFIAILLLILIAVFYAILVIARMLRSKKDSAQWKDKQRQVLCLSDVGSQNNSNRYLLEANDLMKSVNKGKGTELPIFGLDMIRDATDYFSMENKLGEGGFGPVFKGKLASGQMIAVKRLSKGSGQGMLEFENEVILIAKLQHRNLVRLLGCCMQGEEKMLIYEYMPNKSLDAFLFDKTKKQELDWKTRFSIIEGIARGLLYLHRDSRLRIIHRDMKASNILLDEDMNPKISDFGMARIFGGNQNYENTLRIVGTYGYMAPEYAMEGLFSMKSDVFSFGVLLLEIISGKRNVGFIHPDKPLNLLGYAWDSWKDQGSILSFMDPSLHISYSENEVSRCLQVGLLCVQDNTADRPSMDVVVFMLGNEAPILLKPKKPAFSLGRTPRESDVNIKSADLYCSGNAMTTSMEYGSWSNPILRPTPSDEN